MKFQGKTGNKVTSPKGESNINSQKQTEVILRTTGLTKKFGKRTAVNNLNLEIRKGEVFGFLGPNGSGKSTTVSMIVGLIKPTAGSVNAFGMDLKDNYWPIMRKTGSDDRVPRFLPLFKRQGQSGTVLHRHRRHRAGQNHGSTGTGEPGGPRQRQV